MRDKDTYILEEKYSKLNEEMNNRTSYMVQVYNWATGQELPVDEDGYNQAGRSAGIVKTLIEPEYRSKLINIPEFVDILKKSGLDMGDLRTLAPVYVGRLIQEFFKNVTRG